MTIHFISDLSTITMFMPCDATGTEIDLKKKKTQSQSQWIQYAFQFHNFHSCQQQINIQHYFNKEESKSNKMLDFIKQAVEFIL